MDWRRITSDIDALERLSPLEREDRLSAMGAAPDAETEEIRRYFDRQFDLQSFMQTSIGEAGRDAATGAAPLKEGARIGVWRIADLIGAGGMGEVYRAARDDGLYDQTVALKVMRADTQDRRRLFTLERKRLARLDHPGVSRIIDGGVTAEGRPYMAMEFVDGQPIDKYVTLKEPSRRALLGLFLALCRAVSHAHGKLILHRDLKPSNVLVTGEGAVRLIDFGVAALIEGEDGVDPGPLTIAYAAPEQLAREAPSVATDVFALGVLLHELLTGRLPERREDGSVEVDAVALSSPDLSAIAAKATAFDPAARYVSVDALADDVAGVISHRPVAARGDGRLYRIGKSLRRYPAASGLAAAFVLALVVGLWASLSFSGRASQAAARAEAARGEAEHFLRKAEQSAALEGAYADILDRVFGSEEDAARIKTVMLDRASEALARWREDPETAAEISLVVARHFEAAYDFPTSLSVLEPWIAAGFGAPDVLRAGKLELAVALSRTGDKARALELFDALEAEYADPRERLSPERLDYLGERALLTRKRADIERARDVFAEAVAEDDGDDPDALLNNLFFLQEFSKQLGDFETAYRIAVRTAGVYENHPLLDLKDWVAVHLHWVGYELYYRRDLQEAERIIDRIIAWGENHASPEGEAFRLKAHIAMLTDRFAQAEAHLETARALERRNLGVDRYSRAMLVELLVMRGELDRAEAELTAVHADADPQGAREGLHPRIILAEAQLVAARDGPEAASRLLAARGFTRRRALTQPSWKFRLDRLEALGVAAPA